MLLYILITILASQSDQPPKNYSLLDKTINTTKEILQNISNDTLKRSSLLNPEDFDCPMCALNFAYQEGDKYDDVHYKQVFDQYGRLMYHGCPKNRLHF